MAKKKLPMVKLIRQIPKPDLRFTYKLQVQ